MRRCAQALKPPPKLARVILLNTRTSSTSRGLGRGSLMVEERIMGEVPALLRARSVQGIGRLVLGRMGPVLLEHPCQDLQGLRILQDEAHLPAAVEGRLIEVLGAEEGLPPI